MLKIDCHNVSKEHTERRAAESKTTMHWGKARMNTGSSSSTNQWFSAWGRNISVRTGLRTSFCRWACPKGHKLSSVFISYGSELHLPRYAGRYVSEAKLCCGQSVTNHLWRCLRKFLNCPKPFVLPIQTASLFGITCTFISSSYFSKWECNQMKSLWMKWCALKLSVSLTKHF